MRLNLMITIASELAFPKEPFSFSAFGSRRHDFVAIVLASFLLLQYDARAARATTAVSDLNS